MYVGLPAGSERTPRSDWVPERLDERPLHVSFFTERSVGRTRHTLRLFEARERGIPIAGKDIRRWIPEITIRSLDVGDLNDIVLWRLDDLFGALILYRETGDIEAFHYTVCKNILDLSTWAYPHAGHLVPSVPERLNIGNDVVGHGVVGSAIECFRAFGQEAFRVKCGETGHFNADRTQILLDQCIAAYGLAAEGILTESRSLGLGCMMSDHRLRRRWSARFGLLANARLLERSALTALRYPHRAVLQFYVKALSTVCDDPISARSARALLAAIFRVPAQEDTFYV
jgi:hypothetical protein